MIADYIFKSGFSLFRFWALFTQPVKFDKERDFSVNGQFIYCIANSADSAKDMIIEHYNALSISCKSVELTQPITTKNSDLKYLYEPSKTLGYNGVVTPKTENAQKVLQLMDSVDDGESRYNEFVKQVSDETNVPLSQIKEELEPFI